MQRSRRPPRLNYFRLVAIRLDRLLDELEYEGFPQLNIDQRVRIGQLLHTFSDRNIPSVDQLKYKLAALICTSEEEQMRFYKVYNNYVAAFKPGKRSVRPPQRPKRKDAERNKSKKPDRSPYTSPPRPNFGGLAPLPSVPPLELPSVLSPPEPVETTRSGPISFELTFNNTTERAWNLVDLEPVARVLREKEITEKEEWDILSSIRQTIRAGGVPRLQKYYRKKSPQYLFLIEQKSSRDHLAALYTELVAELQGLDLDVDYYFYDNIPLRCWKERRQPASYTSIERLFGNNPQSRLIIIGEPDGLLDRPVMKPSALFLNIREEWSAVALLNTRSTADWDTSESILCNFLPVAPANIGGLGSLLYQWEHQISYTPYYWKTTHTEPATPVVSLSSGEELQQEIQALQVYLGKPAFSLLGAVALYPEVYWKLTKNFQSSILSEPLFLRNANLRRKTWSLMLLRLSRLEWLREGELPVGVREILRNSLQPDSAKRVREELIKVLNLEENHPPEGSYAEADKAYTIALLEYEKQVLEQPAKKKKYETSFRKQAESQGIALSDISDAIGRQIWEKLTAAPPPVPDDAPSETKGPGLEQLMQDYLSLADIKIKEADQALVIKDYTTARNAYQFALTRLEDIRDLSKTAEVLQSLAGMEKLAGDFFEASEHYTSLLTIYKQLGEPSKIAYAQLELAKTFRELGARSNSYELLISAIQIFKQLQNQEGRLAAELELALVEKDRGNFIRALHLLNPVADYYRLTNQLEKLEEIEAHIRAIQEAHEITKASGAVAPEAGLEMLKHSTKLTPENLRVWRMLVDAWYKGTILRGTVQRLVKGGFGVLIEGFETFLPGSHADLFHISDYTRFLAQEFDFKVIKINQAIKNAVISRKMILQDEFLARREEILENLQVDQVYEGIVKNITHFGAFVDLGGVDGLVYITDITWRRLSQPDQELKLHQRVTVKVLSFNSDKKRIALGIKQLLPNPWENFPPEIFVGAVVKGHVVNILNFGIFIEIRPGIEGLIHISEINWGLIRNIDLKTIFQLNQPVEARVMTIDRAQKRMSFSIKSLQQDPWIDISSRFAPGSIVTGRVSNITAYGVFVDLNGEVTGMIHVSDLSWTKRYSHPNEFTEIGQTLEVIILNVDNEKRQLALGYKQLRPNPFIEHKDTFTVGSYHEGKVTAVTNKGATILLLEEFEAFAPSKHIVKEDKSLLEVGEAVTVKVLELNPDKQTILVSHTRYLKDIEDLAARKLQGDPPVKEKKQKPADPASHTMSLQDFGLPLKTVLFIGTNYSNAALMRLENEVRALKTSLKELGIRNEILLNQTQVLRIIDLLPAIYAVQPAIVHFSSHGIGEKGLIFKNRSEKFAVVSPEVLEGIFNPLENSVECVVLNGGYSRDQAKAINKYIPYVIGIHHAIPEPASIRFLAVFYESLGKKSSYQTAFQAGINTISGLGQGTANRPEILVKT